MTRIADLSVVSLLAVSFVFVIVMFAHGPGSGALATAPTPPADCHVANQPSQNGPNAPGDLVAEAAPPSEGEGQSDLTWTDNSVDETCFVIEARPTDVDTWEVVGFAGTNTVEFRDIGPYEQGSDVLYRVYAADDSSRSEYSNEDYASFPIREPTPTPSALYQRGDLNCDGVVDASDALPVLRDSAGLDPGLHPWCPSLDSETR